MAPPSPLWLCSDQKDKHIENWRWVNKHDIALQACLTGHLDPACLHTGRVCIGLARILQISKQGRHQVREFEEMKAAQRRERMQGHHSHTDQGLDSGRSNLLTDLGKGTVPKPQCSLSRMWLQQHLPSGIGCWELRGGKGRKAFDIPTYLPPAPNSENGFSEPSKETIVYLKIL